MSVPFASVRVRRACGFVILSKTPVNSVAEPLVGRMRVVLLRSFECTARSR